MFSSIVLRRLLLTACLLLVLPARAGIYDDILAAANKDDTAQVMDLLRRGMDVNTADPSGSTLLMISARNGNYELLDFLLRSRANSMKRNKYGDSAIMLAALRGHLQAVRRLLDAGANPSNDGWNSLHYAAYAGHIDVVRLLIERKADLDAVAPNGQTALMLAASLGRLEVVKALVDADADMDMEDYEGRTALMLAQKGGHTEVAAYLIEEGADE